MIFVAGGPASDCLLCELLLSYSNNGNFPVLIVFVTNMLASFRKMKREFIKSDIQCL